MPKLDQNVFSAKSKFWKHVPQSAILDGIETLQVPYETRPKCSLIMYVKQKCHHLQFSIYNAKCKFQKHNVLQSAILDIEI